MNIIYGRVIKFVDIKLKKNNFIIMKARNKPVFWYLFFTFIFSWSIILIYYLRGGKWNTPVSVVIGVIYMFMPMTSVLIVKKIIFKENIKEALAVRFNINRWWFAGWLLPLFVAVASLGVSLLFPNVFYSSDMTGFFERFQNIIPADKIAGMKADLKNLPLHPFWLGLIQGLIAGPTVNAVAAFGEELGWRGFLVDELKYMGFWRASFIIGFVWGVWHAPIILMGHNYPAHPVAGVLFMIIFTILLSPIFSYIRLKAKSVIAAAVLHGSLNATSGLAVILLKGGNDLLIGVTGLAGFIVLTVINVILFIIIKQDKSVFETE